MKEIANTNLSLIMVVNQLKFVRNEYLTAANRTYSSKASLLLNAYLLSPSMCPSFQNESVQIVQGASTFSKDASEGEVSFSGNPKTLWVSDHILKAHKLNNFFLKLNKISAKAEQKEGMYTASINFSIFYFHSFWHFVKIFKTIVLLRIVLLMKRI